MVILLCRNEIYGWSLRRDVVGVGGVSLRANQILWTIPTRRGSRRKRSSKEPQDFHTNPRIEQGDLSCSRLALHYSAKCLLINLLKKLTI